MPTESPSKIKLRDKQAVRKLNPSCRAALLWGMSATVNDHRIAPSLIEMCRLAEYRGIVN